MLKAEKAWVWQTPQTLCWEDCFAAAAAAAAVWRVTSSRNPVDTSNQVACSSSQQEWAEHWTVVALLEQYIYMYKHWCYTTVIQCLNSLANWCAVHAAIQFISITSTEERADLVLGRALVADAAVRRLPGIPYLSRSTLPVPVPSRNEQSIEQILACWKHTRTCASSMSCQSCQLMWRSCRESVRINHQHRTESTRTHAGVSLTTVREPFSSQSPSC